MRKIFNTVLLLLVLFIASMAHVFAQEEDNCPDVENKKGKKLFDQGFEKFRDKKFNEAAPLFRQVLEIDSSCGKCYFFLGMMSFKKIDYNLKAATKYFEQSIQLCPDFDINVYYYLGDIYYGAENWAMAEKYLTKYLKDPTKIDSDADQARAQAMLKYSKMYNKMFSNPVPFDPHCVKGVSSPTDEYIPSMSPDGETMFYARVIKLPPNKDDLIQKPVFTEKFYFSVKKNGTYTDGEEMPYPFNMNQNEGGASLTIDNNELYYTVCKDKGTYYNCDIYYTKKDAEGLWSDPVALTNVNNDDTWESMPCISADGNTLYFVSDRPGGYGGYDIWFSKKNAKGEWSTPINAGKNINTSGNEKTPFLHSDGQTLYFSSDSPDLGGLGSYDIYYSRLQADGSWGKPVNIGFPINSDADDAGFFVSLDGKTGFFSSNKLKCSGGWDVYSFDLYKEARPDEMKILKGSVKEEVSEKPVKARVEIKNVETKKVKQIPVDSISGQYALVINTKNDYIMTVKKEDYAYESKLIPAEDTMKKETVKEVNFEVKPIAVGQSYKLNDIYFGSNQFELNNDTKAILDGFIEFLNENPRIKVAIHGHTDNVGNDQDNLLLSENRSKTVYAYLVDHGINTTRLSYKGFGKTKPVATNDTEDGRARNRRTEFVILEK
jgi:outer membrane protein OmpA-like peptidoglycan-associated protein/tetratricopeptide (TPR) repeat protein